MLSAGHEHATVRMLQKRQTRRRQKHYGGERTAALHDAGARHAAAPNGRGRLRLLDVVAKAKAALKRTQSRRWRDSLAASFHHNGLDCGGRTCGTGAEMTLTGRGMTTAGRGACESGVALRFPPHSRTFWGGTRCGKGANCLHSAASGHIWPRLSAFFGGAALQQRETWLPSESGVVPPQFPKKPEKASFKGALVRLYLSHNNLRLFSRCVHPLTSLDFSRPCLDPGEPLPAVFEERSTASRPWLQAAGSVWPVWGRFWLPKPATSQLPQKSCALRVAWSAGRRANRPGQDMTVSSLRRLQARQQRLIECGGFWSENEACVGFVGFRVGFVGFFRVFYQATLGWVRGKRPGGGGQIYTCRRCGLQPPLQGKAGTKMEDSA